ncbi:MAG: hypothetical protein OXC14_04690 [Rhodospirillaceae bacterium]|nr:hypothetical protein [Rhodospirillaceae bacterium]
MALTNWFGMADGNAAWRRGEARLSGRNHVAKACRDYPFRAQPLDLGRRFQVVSQFLKEIDAQDVASDADALDTGLEPRQLVASRMAAVFGGDADRMVEPAVGFLFGGGLLGAEHQSLD